MGVVTQQAINNSTFQNEHDIGKAVSDWTVNNNKKHVDKTSITILPNINSYYSKIILLNTFSLVILSNILPLGDISSVQLNNAYKIEIDSNVKERILLVRRVRIDGQKDASKVAERELYKSRWWAYKWLNRFDKHGLEGLKDHPRSGSRPPLISQKKMLKIKQEISENSSGWQVKQVMDIIYKKTGVKYHEVHIYRLLHKWGFSAKVPQKRFVNIASIKEEKDAFKKGYKNYSRKSQKDSQ